MVNLLKPNFVEDRGYCYDKEDYFLFVGRLSEEKGILQSIQACIKTKSNLKIAGTGPLKEEIKSLSAQYPFIEYLDFQTESQLQQLYLKAKALITASQMYETFGLVIIEAFSCGTPVIAPNFGTASKLVTHKVNGELYATREKEGLSNAIESFKKNRGIALQQSARDIFVQKYSKERNLDRLEYLYDSVS